MAVAQGLHVHGHRDVGPLPSHRGTLGAVEVPVGPARTGRRPGAGRGCAGPSLLPPEARHRPWPEALSGRPLLPPGRALPPPGPSGSGRPATRPPTGTRPSDRRPGLIGQPPQASCLDHFGDPLKLGEPGWRLVLGQGGGIIRKGIQDQPHLIFCSAAIEHVFDNGGSAARSPVKFVTVESNSCPYNVQRDRYNSRAMTSRWISLVPS